jgi:DNA-binding NarL/FixJ family response regulator
LTHPELVPFRVLIADGQAIFVEIFTSFIETAAASKYRASITSSSSRADNILGLCRVTKFDLVIMRLNNIIFPEIGIGTRPTRSARWLRFITEIKTMRSCRIIALCGYMTEDPVLDTLHVTDAIAAGADYFFTIPAAGGDLIGAIGKCLSEWSRQESL